MGALGMRTLNRAGDARAAAEDSLEDYAFRYVPRSFRRWSALSVGGTALGSIAFLADFSIGASIGLEHGTANAMLGILLASVIIFAVGFPVAYYAARYDLDLDLVARGSGFGVVQIDFLDADLFTQLGGEAGWCGCERSDRGRQNSP